MSDKFKDCEEEKFYAPTNQIGGVKINPACGTEPLKIPEELREPKGKQDQEYILQTPRPIQVSNISITAVCDDINLPGSEGFPVTIAAKEFATLISFNTIAGIADTVLDYIAVNKLEDIIEQQLEARTLTVQELVDLTGLTFTQAQTFLRLAESQQTTLDISARTLAESRLVCLWWNDEQEAECPDPLMATSNEFPLAQYRVIIARHTVSSEISKEDANNKALALAQAGLNCLYISDIFTAKCTTRAERPYTITEHVPNDEVSINDLPLRVGTFTVPAGAFISTTSKEDANSQAEAYAWAQLECFYINELVERKCKDENARNRGEDPKFSIAKPADIYNRIPGQSVVIPVGFFVSDLSTADATAQAIALAESLLECCYMSEAITRTCPTDVDGHAASPTGSGMYTVTIERGAFIGCESQEAVDAEAEAYAASLLQCAYCNDTIFPACVPDWVVKAATEGVLITQEALRGRTEIVIQGETYFEGSLYKLKLPLETAGLVNPYTGIEEDTSSWSQDATVGIDKDSVCSEIKKQEAIDIAETIAQRPAATIIEEVEGEACRYTNPRMFLGCSFPDPYLYPTHELPTEDAKHWMYTYYDSVNPVAINTLQNDTEEISYRKIKGGEQYVVYQKANGPCHALAASSTADFSYIEIEPGMLTMAPAEIPWLNTSDLTSDEMRIATVEYLEKLILTMFLPSVQCHYQNPPMAVACSWTRKISTGCSMEQINVGAGTNFSIDSETAAEWANVDVELLKPETYQANWPAADDIIAQQNFIANARMREYVQVKAEGDPDPEGTALPPYPTNTWREWDPELQGLISKTGYGFSDPQAAYWWYGLSKPIAWEERLVEGAPSTDAPILIAPGTFTGPDYTAVMHQTVAMAHMLIQGRCKYFNKEVRAFRSCGCGDAHTKRTHLISSTSWEVSIVIPEGTVQADSPEEADAIALEMANIEANGHCPCIYGNDPIYCNCWAYLKTLQWQGLEPWITPPTPEMMEDMIDRRFELPADTFISENPLEIEALLEEQLDENCAEMVCKLQAQWLMWKSGKIKCKCCCNPLLGGTPYFCGPVVIDEKTGQCIELTFQAGAVVGSRKNMPKRVQETCWEQCTLLTYLAHTSKLPCASFQVIVNATVGGAYCYDITNGRVRLPGGKIVSVPYVTNFYCTSNGPFKGEITLKTSKAKIADTGKIQHFVHYVAIDENGVVVKSIQAYPIF